MKKVIALVPGDGIGPDVVGEAVKVLHAVGKAYGHEFVCESYLLGGCSIDRYGVPMTDETLAACKASDSVLLGAVGGPKWDHVDPSIRPEKALLGLRKGLGLFCNLRPAMMYPQLRHASPLKDEIIGDGLDVMVVRELTGGIYFGKRGTTEDGAFDTMEYHRYEIERIVRKGFEIAMKRQKRLTSVDKANILASSQLWRSIVENIAPEYPEVAVNHLYVDNASMQLVRNPKQFDVIVTCNMFGDILSDEASQITGSIGMLPSASLGEGSRGMYEPIHGSAPDIAGKNIANPLATILSVAMMLRYSFGLEQEAAAIERAVGETLDAGYRTSDIYTDGMQKVGTKEMGDQVARRI
ncbi:MAG: 3-isopropylmalate dehydrogenase [Sphaerochaeta sp.]|jgi:3-isopropylmalate dehydrogenase|nr:3-isopropylmalate dehydrogenase [Sphaerochaeta sp.]MCH3919209.1 3-isopropylmalate dehydrogenase [Sphaerochaeta sp.]MCI2045944.1 3-isopropylmalate dehydrogenase [Sphaerochaeta sp.]MCI2076280.1 3-isopropylmalate dehydrogenase [Sphaerochaeta sp.]MCI2097154.1 3-isopropylmalate dehydrogenase [Sphaerochaeta sp.]